MRKHDARKFIGTVGSERPILPDFSKKPVKYFFAYRPPQALKTKEIRTASELLSAQADHVNIAERRRDFGL